ncbi:MAG: hypothetical protein ACREK4_24140 [Candidatus Rokuibacteriota bacterium]
MTKPPEAKAETLARRVFAALDDGEADARLLDGDKFKRRAGATVNGEVRELGRVLATYGAPVDTLELYVWRHAAEFDVRERLTKPLDDPKRSSAMFAFRGSALEHRLTP